MITYHNLWDLLNKKGITTYTLIKKHGISGNQINRWKHGEDMKLSTLNRLCYILECEPCDILTYDPDEKSPVLLRDQNVLSVAESPEFPLLENDDEQPESEKHKATSHLSEKLNQLIKEKDIAPRSLARQSGVPLPTLRNIQYGKTKNPRTETLSALAKALNVPVEDLLE